MKKIRSCGMDETCSDHEPPAREWSQTALGVRIDITSDRKIAGRESFSGGFRGGGSSAAGPIAANKTDLHAAGGELDMDEALGIHPHPGTAGAHPVVARGPLADTSDTSTSPRAESPKGLLVDRMWSKTALGVTIDIGSEKPIAGRPSFCESPACCTWRTWQTAPSGAAKLVHLMSSGCALPHRHALNLSACSRGLQRHSCGRCRAHRCQGNRPQLPRRQPPAGHGWTAGDHPAPGDRRRTPLFGNRPSGPSREAGPSLS